MPGKRKTVTRFSQLGRDGEQRRKESQEWTSQMGGRVAALGTCTRQTLTLTGALGSCFPTFAFHKSHEASELSSRHKNVSEFITENIINNETDVYGESGESIFCCELYNCRAATSSLSGVPGGVLAATSATLFLASSSFFSAWLQKPNVGMQPLCLASRRTDIWMILPSCSH